MYRRKGSTSTGPTFAPQLPTNRRVPSVDVLRGHSKHLCGLSSRRRQEKCLRYREQFTSAALTLSRTTESYGTPALAAEGDAFITPVIFARNVFLLFSCECSIALEETRVRRSAAPHGHAARPHILLISGQTNQHRRFHIYTVGDSRTKPLTLPHRPACPHQLKIKVLLYCVEEKSRYILLKKVSVFS